MACGKKGNYKTAVKENDVKLTEEQIRQNEFSKQKKQIENKKNNEFKLCEMGRMYARIYPNGNVYRCCAYDGNTYLGNLFDKTIKLLDKPEKCYDIKDCRCWRCMIPGEESRWLNTWMDDWEISFRGFMENILEQAYKLQNNKQFNESTELFQKLLEDKKYYPVAVLKSVKTIKWPIIP